MTERTRQLLDEILKLSLTERVELFEELEAQLAGSLDPQFMDEVHRRVDRVLAGDRSGSTVSEVRARIEARIAERRPPS